MKTVAGAIMEFDLRACEDLTEPRQRILAHQIFLTGFAVGQAYANAAIQSCVRGDRFDIGTLNQIMLDYANQIIAAQVQIDSKTGV